MARITRERIFKHRYAVLGEGITEQWYLNHLKKYKAYRYTIKPSLFANIGLENAERFIDNLLASGYDQITFLTDYDTILSQNRQDQFDRLVRKYEGCGEVFICESMPSIEIWFLLHFSYTTQEFVDYESIKRVLRRKLTGYEKSRKYLATAGWFDSLIQDGGLEKAQENAKRLLGRLKMGNVGRHCPFTKMHLAIEEFEKQKRK